MLCVSTLPWLVCGREHEVIKLLCWLCGDKLHHASSSSSSLSLSPSTLPVDIVVRLMSKSPSQSCSLARHSGNPPHVPATAC